MKKIMILFLVCVFGACSESSEKAPDNLLSQQQMAMILIDAHLGEAGLLQKPKDRDSNQALYSRYMQQVYKKHGVDPKVFEASYKYYALDTKKFDEIYQVVVDSLNSMEGQSGYKPPEVEHHPMTDTSKLFKKLRKPKDDDQSSQDSDP